MPRFPHQTSALARLEELRGAALFLDMGTGKTRIILEDLARPGLQPALVLAPRAVLTHWENEARKWVPWLPVQRIEKRKDVKKLYRPTGIMIVGYDLFKRLEPPSWGWGFRAVVADESTKVKNPDSERTVAIRKAYRSAVWRRVVSGFPAPEGLGDLWSQYDLLEPETLGASRKELVTWAKTNEGAAEARVIEATNWMTIRARREDVLPWLPGRSFAIRTCAPSKATRGLSEQIKKSWSTPAKTITQATDRVAKLLQITCGFHYGEGGICVEHHDDGKVRLLVDLLLEIAPDERVVVWTPWIAHANILHRDLARRTRRTITRDIEAYRATPGAVLVTTFKLAMGVTLVEGRYSVYAARPYAAEARAQSLDRQHRPGQERPVHIIDLVAETWEDEQYYHALEEKVSLAEAIAQGRFGEAAKPTGSQP